MEFEEWLNSLICEEAGPHTAKFGDILNHIKANLHCEGQKQELHEFVRLAFAYGRFSERKMMQTRIDTLYESAVFNEVIKAMEDKAEL